MRDQESKMSRDDYPLVCVLGGGVLKTEISLVCSPPPLYFNHKGNHTLNNWNNPLLRFFSITTCPSYVVLGIECHNLSLWWKNNLRRPFVGRCSLIPDARPLGETIWIVSKPSHIFSLSLMILPQLLYGDNLLFQWQKPLHLLPAISFWPLGLSF